jgi:cyclohexadieny/prephenate dehydrogenase
MTQAPLPSLPAPLFDTVAVIGVGLIGSSIARALYRTRGATRVVLHDHDPAALARAEALGLAPAYAGSVAEAVAGADLVILCAPVGANAEIAEAMAPALKAGAIVSDVGSVKTSVVADVGRHLPEGVHFVPAHPVAGTEHSGPDAGFSTLFRNRWCILTPPPGTDADAIEKVRALWTAFGANVEVMTPEHHDLVLAITSHVPHLVAYNLVGTAADLEDSLRSEVIKFSAGGFRDSTRLAASDPTMWRDVFLYNREAVLEMLGRFTEELTALQRMIRRGDGQGLFDLFTRTRAIRRAIVEQGQETAAPDFGRRTDEGDDAPRSLP